MKKILPILTLFALIMFTADLPASTQLARSTQASMDPIHPRDVNRLLKIAADYWSLSVGQARQAYNQGTMTLTPYPQQGDNVYMILYDGLCLIAALEDKF